MRGRQTLALQPPAHRAPGPELPTSLPLSQDPGCCGGLVLGIPAGSEACTPAVAAGSRREGPARRRHCALSTSGEGPSSAHPRLHPTLTPSSGERTSLPSPVGDGGLSPRPSPRTPLLERSWVGPQPPQPEAAPLGWCLARPAVLLSDACGEAAGPRPAVQPGDLWAERPPGPGWLAGVGVGGHGTGSCSAAPHT